MKLILLPLMIASSLLAENVAFWEIQKVKANDTLNIRSLATYKSEKISSIPHNEKCVINHGCGKNISLEAMMDLQEDEIQIFLDQAKEDWCYVEYKGKKAWAKKHYLKASSSTCK